MTSLGCVSPKNTSTMKRTKEYTHSNSNPKFLK
jgi:hypothetical protein